MIGDIKGDGVYPGILEDQITADAWNNILRNQDGGVNSSKFLTTYWNGSAAATLPADTVKVAWNANSIWSDDVNANDVVKAYLDDNNQDPTATVTGIPYDTYDVIIYCHGEGSRSKFHPYTVNGWSYTYADGATIFNGTADWGNRQQQPEEGKNALRINGLSGDLTIKGQRRTNNVANGTISSIQIVKNTGTATKPNATAFSYGPNPTVAPTGWFTSWSNGGIERMIGPEGVDVLAIKNKDNCQYASVANVSGKSAFTIAAIVNFDNVKPGEGEYAVLWSIGRFNNKQQGLMLTKGGDGNLYLQHTYKRDGNNYRFGPYTPKDGDNQSKPYCNAGAVSRGFHLVTATYDVPNQKMTLKVDNGEPIVAAVSESDNAIGKLENLADGGMQLGNAYGHDEAPLVQGLGVAFDRVMAWDSALTDDQLTTLWNGYSAVVQKPLVPAYQSDLVSNGATIYVPDMTTTAYHLSISEGTMKVPEGTTVTVPSIRLANQDKLADRVRQYGLDIAGTVNVTAASLQPNVYSDMGSTGANKRGVLLGHWSGNGTINVTGTLDAPDAFIDTVQDGKITTTLNIDGGKVTGRGLYANKSDQSTINISNGGVLELAAFEGVNAIALNAAKGTIKAVASGTYTIGWKYNGAVAFTDATDGTTLDPNGKDIEFLSAATFSGNIVVSDSSTEGNGTVKLDSVSGTGTFSVLNGVLYLPVGHGLTAAVGTVKDAQGSTSTYEKYVKEGYEAQPVAKIGETEFYTVEAAVNSLNGEAGTIKLCADAASESVTLGAGQSLNTNGFAIGAVTAANGAVLGLVGGVYTSYAANEGEEWTGNGTDNKWTTAANWDKGFVPLATTPVTFNTAATVGIDDNAPKNYCASLTLNADVTLVRGINNWVQLFMYGGITGSGKLTLNMVCLNNATDPATKLEIACPLVVTSLEHDSSLRGSAGGWKISNALTIDGWIKTEAGSVDVTGTATITTNVKFETNVALTFDGTTTIQPNATLTIGGNVKAGENASFVLGGALATLVDNTKSLTAEKVSAAQGYSLYTDGATIWKVLAADKTWTPVADGDYDWGTAENWSPNGVPTADNRVVFNGDTTVNNKNNARYSCGPITMNGNVIITGSNGQSEIQVNGDITGSGTLTFRGAGPKRASGSGIIGESINVVFEYGTVNGPWMSNGVTINGDVTIKTGVASWDAQNTINGTTTFTVSEFATSGGDKNLVFGPIHVENDLAINKGGPKVVLNGAVTVDGGKTLTIATDDTGKVDVSGATFVLSGVGATLVDNGGAIDSTKVTTVAGKIVNSETVDSVTTYTAVLAVAKIERNGEETQYFDTLQAAVNAAAASDTITIIADDPSSLTVPTGWEIKTEGGVNTLVKLPAVATVTANGTTTEYYDLHDALEACKASSTTITLLADVDLAGVNWVPVGTSASPFKGVFDGNGKTISNLSVDDETLTYAGLLGNVQGSTLKDITISNVTINAEASIGSLMGYCNTSSTTNCHIQGRIQLSGHYKMGGILGEGYTSFTDCSVIGDGVSTSAILATPLMKKDDPTDYKHEADNIGGMVGHWSEGTATIKNCTVKDISVTGYRKLGGMVGISFCSQKIEDVTVENVKVTCTAPKAYAEDNTSTTGMGGIVGQYHRQGGSYTGGWMKGATVKNVTLLATDPEALSIIKAGLVSSGLRDTADAESPIAKASMTFSDITFEGENSIPEGVKTMNDAAFGPVVVAQIVGGDTYTTLQAAVEAAQSGDTIELLKDIEISGAATAVAINKVGTYTIDGKGHTISPADSAYVYHRFMFGMSGQSYDPMRNYTVTNLVITGFSDSTYFIRSEGCSVTFADCTITNNLLDNMDNNAQGSTNRLMLCTSADMTIDGCVIANNSSHSNLIDFNSNGVLNEESGSLTVTGNLFKDNTLSGSGVIFSNGSAGTSDKIEDNTFSGNTITASAGAVLYLSGKVDSVSGNLFTGNTVTATGKEAVIVLGSKSTGTVVNGNAFVGNTLPDGTTKYATFYTGADCDVSGNYWGDGEAPETGTGLDIRIDDGKTPTITVDGYATAYAVNENGRGVTVTLSIAITEADVELVGDKADIKTAGAIDGDKLWVKDGSGDWAVDVSVTISGTEISGVPLPTVETPVKYYTVAKEGATLDAETVKGNVIGALRVNSSLTNTIIAVPWAKIGGGAVTVSNLVATATLTAGDTLQAYDKDTGKFYQWTLNANKKWDSDTTVDSGSSDVADDADGYTIPRGAGVWLTRQNPTEPLYLIGEVATGDAETALDTATTANTDGSQAWNLVAPPTAEAFSLNDAEKGITPVGGFDRILVPTATVPRNYTYKDGEGWGYYKTTVENGRVTSAWTADENATVPAGTGFWYLNSSSSSEESKIDWIK